MLHLVLNHHFFRTLFALKLEVLIKIFLSLITVITK